MEHYERLENKIDKLVDASSTQNIVLTRVDLNLQNYEKNANNRIDIIEECADKSALALNGTLEKPGLIAKFSKFNLKFKILIAVVGILCIITLPLVLNTEAKLIASTFISVLK